MRCQAGKPDLRRIVGQAFQPDGMRRQAGKPDLRTYSWRLLKMNEALTTIRSHITPPGTKFRAASTYFFS